MEIRKPNSVDWILYSLVVITFITCMTVMIVGAIRKEKVLTMENFGYHLQIEMTDYTNTTYSIGIKTKRKKFARYENVIIKYEVTNVEENKTVQRTLTKTVIDDKDILEKFQHTLQSDNRVKTTLSLKITSITGDIVYVSNYISHKALTFVSQKNT